MLLPNLRFDQPFTCTDSTGAVVAPTGTPTGTLFKNGASTSVSVTVTMTGGLGIASCTIPSDAVAGDRFYLKVSAVISGVTYDTLGPSDAVESPHALTTAYDAAKTAAPTVGAVAAAVRTDQALELSRLYAAVSTRATPGSAMALTPSERTTLAGVVEAGFLDDLTGGAFLAGITTQVQSLFDSGTDVPVATLVNLVAAGVRTNLATELARIDVAVGTRLATNGYTAPPTAAVNATAVRTELTTELGKLDATVGSRLSSSAYTAPTIPPTPAAIATQVRTELTPELGKLDATVGSRLAAASYTAPTTPPSPPTAQAIATQVRAELTTELGKLDANISTRATPGAAMSLTVGERTTLAGALETELLNDATGGAFLAGIQSSIQAILDSNTDVPVVAIAAAVAAAVRTNLQTELARIDQAISSRLATSGYTAPPSVGNLATSAEVSELATQLESIPAVAEIAGSILLDPTKKLLTNDGGFVTSTSNGNGTTNVSTFVMPIRSTSTERVLPNRIDLFVRERVPLAITIYDDKQQPVDCSGLTCTLFVTGGVEVPGLTPQPIEPGSVPNRYLFTPPEAMTAKAGTLWFGLRVTGDTKRVLAFGHVVVAELP